MPRSGGSALHGVIPNLKQKKTKKTKNQCSAKQKQVFQIWMVSEVLQIIFAAKLIQIFPCKQSCRLETGKNVKNCKQIENKFQSWFEKLIFWRKISKTPYLDVFFKNITVKQVSFQKHLETIFLPFLLMRIKTKLQLRLITPQDYKASCADFFS